MKRIILLIIIVGFILSGCCTTEMWQEKARDADWLPAEDCPEYTPPERTPLPHPTLPQLEYPTDEEGNPLPITIDAVMEHVFLLSGAIEKFMILVEIYEREYVLSENEQYSNERFKEMSLDELKAEYLRLLGVIKDKESEEPE